MNFSLIDIVFVVFLLFMSIIGYKKGFISELYDVISSIAVLVLSYLFAKPLSTIITLYPYGKDNVITAFVGQMINQMLMFGLLLLVLFLIKKGLGVVIKPLLKSLMNVLKLTGFVNHFLGVILSLVEGLIISYCVLVFFVIPILPTGRDMVSDSVLSQTLIGTVPQVEEFLQTIDLSAYDSSQLSYETLIQSLISAEKAGVIDDQQFQTLFDENIKSDILEGKVSLSTDKKEELITLLEKHGYNQQVIQEINEKISESDTK